MSRLWILLAVAAGCAEPLADDRCLRNLPPYRPVVATTFDRYYDVVPDQLGFAIGPYQDPEGDPFAAAEVEVWSVSPSTEALITRVWSATLGEPPTAPATVTLADGAFDLGLTTLAPHTRYAIIARYRDRVEGTDDCGAWGPWSPPARFGTDDGSAALFADDQIGSVYLEIPQASYAAINAQAIPPRCEAFERDYHPGAVRIGGERFDGAGIKIKGGCGSARNLSRKAGFKVNLGWDDPAVAGCPAKRRHRGQRTLTLNNGVQDPTASNERLGFAYYQALGVGSSRAVSVKLYVNDAYWGLYTLVESVERRMLARWYPSDRGMLYEGAYSCDLVAASLPFAETDDECLRREFHAGPCDEPEPGDDPLTFGPLRLLVAKLAALVDGTFVRDVEKYFDLDEYLSLWAADAVIGSWDSYTFNFINNYRVYHDPSDDRWHLIQSGIDQIMGQDDRDVLPFAPQGLLARKCLRDPACQDRFAARLAQAVTVFEDMRMTERAAAIRTQIRPDVASDPRREYSMTEFDAAHARRQTWLAGRAALIRQRLADAGY